MRSKLFCAALLLAAPVPAFAHVTLAEPQAKPGAQYTAQFTVGHGCDGSPTTMLAVHIPDGVTGLKPEAKAGWSVEMQRDGAKISQVVWKGGLIPADQKDSFSLDMVLPSRTGQLVFTADQTCQKGSESWSELPAADGHKLKNPAPILTLTPTPVKSTGDSMAGMDMSGMGNMKMSGMKMGGAAPAGANLQGVSVTDAWIRALPSAVPSGGYFTLHNGGTKPVVLTGASSPGCGMLMLHKSEDKGGMSSMTDVSEVPVAAGASVQFTPVGFHLMCMDSKPAIKPGASVPVTLSFKDGAEMTVSFAVRNAAGK
jgi:copper(I)-binding protein/uncharacterized protein YcnI